MGTRKNWEQNAPGWTELARAGYDVYRDSFNTPEFLKLLPDVRGLLGLDLGCGEGHNTRRVAELGGRVVGLDHSTAFVRAATALGGADYVVGDGLGLPFGDATFDFATAFMSVMDMPDIAQVLREMARVLRPGGFFQFSITHPCFSPPHRRNLKNPDGTTRAIEVGDYYAEGLRTETWLFSAAPAEVRSQYTPFTIPSIHLTLSSWFRLIRDAGLFIEELNEPKPSAQALARWPNVQDATVVSYFLHVRLRKPSL